MNLSPVGTPVVVGNLEVLEGGVKEYVGGQTALFSIFPDFHISDDIGYFLI